MTIHITQGNGDVNSPLLVIAKTKLKTPKDWLKLPRRKFQTTRMNGQRATSLRSPMTSMSRRACTMHKRAAPTRQKRPPTMMFSAGPQKIPSPRTSPSAKQSKQQKLDIIYLFNSPTLAYDKTQGGHHK
jgi:hypothetical protein